MRLERAVEILQRLRDGEDPRTERPLPPGNPAQEPDVVRALYTVLAAVEVKTGEDGNGRPEPLVATEPASPPRPPRARAGKPWNEEEDARLAALFDGGSSVEQMAGEVERSAYAVRVRLMKLGKLTAEDVLRRRNRPPEPAAAAAAAG